MDRLSLVKALIELTVPDFNKLIAAIPKSSNNISRHSTVPEQVSELLSWAESSTGPGLDEIYQTFLKLFTSVQYEHIIPRPPAIFAMPDYIPGHKFVGRTRELLLINNWANSDEPVLLFEAIGGMGKSMLTWMWFCENARAVRSDWSGIFWYSFYERGADMSDFCAHALAYTTGRPLEDYHGRGTSILSHMLFNVLKRNPWLFVLDGLERILIAYHRLDAAQLPDEQVGTNPDHTERRPDTCIKPADDELLRLLSSARPSKLLMSSRLFPRPLLNKSGLPLPGVKHVKLHGLDPSDAERLLRDMGVQGESSRIQFYLQRHFGCHPLVVGVVAGLVINYRSSPNDFDRWADDPSGGAEPKLAEMDLVQRRNHILKLAFDSLNSEARTLLARIALISEAIDFQTLEDLSPYEEPNFGLFRFLVRASRDLWAFLLGEGRFPRHSHLSPEDPKYHQRLVSTLNDLESRGLLQWNRERNEYDLHPVVRGYAVSSLSIGDQLAEGQRVVDHFSSRSDPPYDRATTLNDLRNGLQVVRTLVQLGKYQSAVDMLGRGLSNAMLWNLEAYHEFLAVIKPIFPDGWNHPPRELKRESDAGYLASQADLALSSIGRMDEAILANQYAIQESMKYHQINNIILSIISGYENYVGANRIQEASRMLTLVSDLTPLRPTPENVAMLHLRILQYQTLVGNNTLAQEAWDKFDSLPRPTSRTMYRPGDGECSLAELRMHLGRLEAALLVSAHKLAEFGKNRWAIRELYRIRGEWMLALERWSDAEEAFGNAISMAREVELTKPGLEARIALVRVKQNQYNSARDSADRLADLDNPPHIELAELYLGLGDCDKARAHAISGYRWAWADGMPFVNWWPLQRCRKVFEALGECEPQFPPFDYSRGKPLLFDSDVLSTIEKLKQFYV